jgi:hypothetical protein
MSLNAETRAALVFLILYFTLFLILLFGYITRRIVFGSRYSIIFFHVTVRLASQATGVAFGVVGYSNTNLLVAYFILGAEGYFTLVICTYRFLISWQMENTPARDSWLEHKHPPGTPWFVRFRDSFALFGGKRHPMSIIHSCMIVANALIITGGSELAGIQSHPSQYTQILHRARVMRITGQSVFLAVTAFLLFAIVKTVRQCKRDRSDGRVHPTLLILLVCWPFLFTRGLYGVLSPFLALFNYFAPSNYGADGLTSAFVATEYILSVSMEWTTCSLLMSTYYTSRNDPKEADVEKKDVEKKDAPVDHPADLFT